MLDCLLYKCEALSSNPCPTKKKNGLPVHGVLETWPQARQGKGAAVGLTESQGWVGSEPLHSFHKHLWSAHCIQPPLPGSSNQVLPWQKS
jgi:hypothetical protein